MKTSEELKKIVREKYAEIATEQPSCGCGCGCDSSKNYSVFSEDYMTKPGYMEDADLGLGCGLPTEHAGIKEGDSVLDLGSGAGNDCFVARAIVGDNGKVTGLDFTDEMILKAKKNNQKLGYKNVEFIKGDIDNMPIPDNSYDVVISNCVLNLVPDKQKAFQEIFRVLKKKGHFCISDIVLDGSLPPKLQEAAELYAGCVSGAMQKSDYLGVIRSVGFKNTEIKTEMKNIIPDYILMDYLTPDEVTEFKKSGTGIFSITITSEK
jgi:ubiquinone/menaquinone biosynthesis C-methylase UbiE